VSSSVRAQGVHALLKFGAENHMRALYEHGTVYLNTLEYFRRGEDGRVRFDTDEGLHSIYQGPQVTYRFDVRGETIHRMGGDDVNALRIWQPGREDVNVYCMTALCEPGDHRLDARFDGFGRACVKINNPKEFLDRFKAAAQSAAESVQPGLVEYVSARGHVGDMGVFRKLDTFAWQSELRIAVEPLVSTRGPIQFTLGSLRDVADLIVLPKASPVI
jgi:hypothetical protein